MTNKIVWSGKTSSYHHKWHDTPNPDDVKAGFREVFFLDAQWSTCPIEVENEVKQMWRNYELHNDVCIIKTSLEELVDQNEYPATIQYITEQKPDIDPEALILIHWWW